MPATLKQTILAPDSYPKRAGIGYNAYDWDDPDYNPTAFTEKFIIDNPPKWADVQRPPDPAPGRSICLDSIAHYSGGVV